MSDLGNKKIMSDNIKKYMSLNNVSRAQICESLKIPYTTFNDWFNGVTYPRIDKIEMMSNYFGINKSDLVEGKVDGREVLTDSERDFARRYRCASEDIKKAVNAILDISEGVEK